MKKDNLLNFLILVFLYIGVSSFPFDLFIKGSKIIILICQCGIQILYSVLAYFFIKRSTDFKFDKKSRKLSWLIFIPCFLACFSNYLYMAFMPSDVNPHFALEMIPQIVLFVIVALNEEMIFRVLFLNNNEFKNPLTAILVGAGIFAICHLNVFFSSLNPADLIVVCYTFLLGLMLGLVYLFTRNFALIASIHFAFNLFNKVLFESFVSNIKNIWLYLLSNGIIVLILIVYLVILFVKKVSILGSEGE